MDDKWLLLSTGAAFYTNTRIAVCGASWSFVWPAIIVQASTHTMSLFNSCSRI